MNGNPFNGLLLGFTIVPLIPAIILFTLGYLRYFKRRGWERTDAITIADHKFGLGYPKPIVKYEANGTFYETQSSLGQRPHLPGGKKVKVFYNPDNPEEMIIDTFMQRGSFFFLVGSFFLFFSIASIILWLITQSLFRIFI